MTKTETQPSRQPDSDSDRQLKEAESNASIPAVLDTFLGTLRQIPEVADALAASFFEGTEEEKAKIKDGSLDFPRNGFTWTLDLHNYRDIKSFTLLKRKQPRTADSDEISEGIHTTIVPNQNGEIKRAYIGYSHEFTPSSFTQLLEGENHSNQQRTIKRAYEFHELLKTGKRSTEKPHRRGPVSRYLRAKFSR